MDMLNFRCVTGKYKFIHDINHCQEILSLLKNMKVYYVMHTSQTKPLQNPLLHVLIYTSLSKWPSFFGAFLLKFCLNFCSPYGHLSTFISISLIIFGETFKLCNPRVIFITILYIQKQNL